MNISESAGNSPFEILAEQYDSWYNSEKGKILYENEKKCVEKLLGDCNEVLEVGVGTGRFALLDVRVVGVDIAFAPLKIAKARGIPVVQAAAEALPFRENSIPCVMFIVSFSFIKNKARALSEAKRVLKTNGKIIICDVLKNSEWGCLYEEKKRQGHPFYSNANFYSFKELEEIISDCGLKITKIFGTLKKSPFEEPSPEEPVEIKSFDQLPGFVCIELKLS